MCSELKLLDVTLRDGAFAVGFDWPPVVLDSILRAQRDAALDYVELGYLGGLPTGHGREAPGPFANLPLALVEAAANILPASRVAVMLHPSGEAERPSFAQLRSAGAELVRVVYHPDWRDRVPPIVRAAKSAGLKVAVNIALASHYLPAELRLHAHWIKTNACPDQMYLADTSSHWLPGDAATATRALADIDLPLGIHAHDFLGMAMGNAAAAIDAGASIVDGSISGVGRGGGNLRLELWAVLAVARGAAKLRPLPLFRAAEEIRSAGIGVDCSPCSAISAALNYTPLDETAISKSALSRGQSLEAALNERLLERARASKSGLGTGPSRS